MATNMYILGVVVTEVERVESAIQALEQAMYHASPAAVNALRSSKKQLEGVLERIMQSEVTSNLSLQNLIEGNRKCLQDCFSASISSGKLSYIGRTRRT
ncbi:hypothetical protein A8L34_16325 [Bacillus sp. FJAT-27264]|nr:hypothetical protein A8L34_16325 [Bacillus sp. FJAT-27264]